MCGIAGYVTRKEVNRSNCIQEIVRSIEHRGPDENGYYLYKNTCLINTRLSIIDISNGKQPFFNEARDVVVVQNGEIYNFIEVKSKLEREGENFRTSSDTEVILKAYERYGVDCVKLFNGMFAIAVLDKKNNKIVLFRDRLGVKPLYIYRNEDEIHFSSEIKSFLKISSFDKSLNYQSIHNYLKFNYIPVGDTIFENVTHLLPGHFLEIDINNLKEEQVQYWNISNEKEKEVNEDEVFNRIEEIMTDAIRIRLRSDVGIGSFLSGGLDSSLVCAMTKAKFGVSLESFSIGFREKRFDESFWAKRVAHLTGIENNVKFLEEDIINLWSTTTWYNDQPHGDISFIPTFILSEFATKKYKLVLTGDGGDEAFAGYTKYFNAFGKSEKEYFDMISLIKKDEEFDSLYTEDFIKKVDYSIPYKIFKNTINEVDEKDFINKILYFDTKQLLPGNNLVKPDKMAMANSLETRSPMLDYRLFEFTQSIKGSFKLSENETKYILKKFALRYLPEDVVYRDKQMFTVPVGEWFKTHLKSYILDILNSDSLKNRNIFNSDHLAFILEEHISERKDYTREIRAIANLELWFREFVD